MFTQKRISGALILSLSILSATVFTGCATTTDTQTNTNSATAIATASPAASAVASPAAAAPAPAAKLNLNTASGADFLRAIPNFGNRMVHEFEEYRPYKSIQQFRKEIGKYVDANTVAEYEKYVFVPFDHNQSDAATLQQIPGLDATEAQELIAGRPYASHDAFLAKLGEKVSADELAVAKAYMAH